MKIYIAHSRGFDYKNELYLPIRQSTLNDAHDIYLPHEESDEAFASKELLKNGCDLLIADVSFPSTGVGIELGWASAYAVPIVCIYKRGSTISNSLKIVATNFIEYSDRQDLIQSLETIIGKNLMS